MKLLSKLDLRPGMRVLDLGGQCEIWASVPIPLDIIIVNLPGEPVEVPNQSHHRFRTIEGDATNLPQFADQSFDLVFSNSVIEHVGDSAMRKRFATEARRLGRQYFIQTPSIWFPLEAHTGVPFWFLLPERIRTAQLKRWRETMPAWTSMVEGTTVVSKSELRALFPEARHHTETLFGLPKSYILLRSSA